MTSFRQPSLVEQMAVVFGIDICEFKALSSPQHTREIRIRLPRHLQYLYATQEEAEDAAADLLRRTGPEQLVKLVSNSNALKEELLRVDDHAPERVVQPASATQAFEAAQAVQAMNLRSERREVSRRKPREYPQEQTGQLPPPKVSPQPQKPEPCDQKTQNEQRKAETQRPEAHFSKFKIPLSNNSADNEWEKIESADPDDDVDDPWITIEDVEEDDHENNNNKNSGFFGSFFTR